MTTLTDADLAALAAYDTPTICNALEVVVPARRGHGFTVDTFQVAHPDLAPMVGYARTVTIRAAEPSPLKGQAARDRRLAYYAYVESGGPRPSIVVIQDLDYVPGTGAFWGEVNTAVHKGLGCLGCITNGSFRDLPQMAPGFQLLGGKICPSHAFVHVVDFGGRVNVHGMAVGDGDLIHADRHGAVVIPAEAARDLPAAAEKIARQEAEVLKEARAAGFSVAALRAAYARADDIH
ncbi:MAG: RraA family protein [Thalassobaculales bacterium]